MQPCFAFLDNLWTQLAQNEFFFGADVTDVGLFANDYVPNKLTVAEDLVAPTFTGYSEKSCTSGSQNKVYDPETGNKGVSLKEPVGGFNWIVGSVPDPAETVYGWWVSNEDGEALFAQRFETPIPITAIGQLISARSLIGYTPDTVLGQPDVG